MGEVVAFQPTQACDLGTHVAIDNTMTTQTRPLPPPAMREIAKVMVRGEILSLQKIITSASGSYREDSVFLAECQTKLAKHEEYLALLVEKFGP
jgi:hypothetical protein